MLSNSWQTSTSTLDQWNSSLVNTDVSPRTEEDSVLFPHPLYNLSYYVWLVASPPMLLVGNFGNIMTIIVMQRHGSGDALVNIYFTALAIVDLLALDMVMAKEVIGVVFGYFIHVQNGIFCKILNWVGGPLTSTGAWFLTCLTDHRAASVVWPHRINALCTRRLVISLLVGIIAFMSALYSHFLYDYYLHYFDKTDEYICIMMSGSYAKFVQNVFTYIDSVVYSVLPFTSNVVASLVLGWKLRAAIQQARHQFAGEKESVCAREKAARSVSVTIMTVSVTYIILTLPATIYFISSYVFDYSDSTTVEDHARSHLIRAVTFMLMFCNSYINFYLYCLTGSTFRKEFLNLFQCSSLSSQT